MKYEYSWGDVESLVLGRAYITRPQIRIFGGIIRIVPILNRKPCCRHFEFKDSDHCIGIDL